MYKLDLFAYIALDLFKMREINGLFDATTLYQNGGSFQNLFRKFTWKTIFVVFMMVFTIEWKSWILNIYLNCIGTFVSFAKCSTKLIFIQNCSTNASKNSSYLSDSLSELDHHNSLNSLLGCLFLTTSALIW